MKEKTDQFFISHVEILEEFLEYLWKNPIRIHEKIIYTQEKAFSIDFVISEKETIRMKTKVEWIRGELMIRMKYTSYYDKNFEEPKSSLLLSFCYDCPNELGLCNQYGLYKKQDLKELEELNDASLIYQYQKEKNMLGDNQFFIFNMNKIKEHCSDKVLDQILQDFDKAIKSTYYK